MQQVLSAYWVPGASRLEELAINEECFTVNGSGVLSTFTLGLNGDGWIKIVSHNHCDYSGVRNPMQSGSAIHNKRLKMLECAIAAISSSSAA